LKYKAKKLSTAVENHVDNSVHFFQQAVHNPAHSIGDRSIARMLITVSNQPD
jgi:hypothetical protein